MQLSLRSQMIAGTAAVVGASAIAMTPVLAAQVNLPSVAHVSGAVQLSAFANPITAIAGVLNGLADNVFNQTYLNGVAYAPDLYWSDAFYATITAGTPPATIFGPVYAPAFVGLIPDLFNQFSTGALSGLVNNLSGYVQAGINAPVNLGAGVATAVLNAPGAVVTAVTYLAQGNTAQALATLQSNIVDPLQSGLAGALYDVGYIVDNVIRNVQTVVTITVPQLLAGIGGQVVAATQYVVQSAVTTVTQIVANLAGLNVEGAWNAAVNGFLGPNGTLGQIQQLTAGIGIVQDVAYSDGATPPVQTVVPTVVVPSIRSVVTGVAQRLGTYPVVNAEGGDGNFYNFPTGGILNDAYAPPALPTASVKQSRSAAARAAASARSAPAVSAPEAAAPAGDSSAAAASSAPAEKPAAHRASRKAARAASTN